MKIKTPDFRKKNKNNEEAAFTGFDLTGGAGNAASGTGAEQPYAGDSGRSTGLNADSSANPGSRKSGAGSSAKRGFNLKGRGKAAGSSTGTVFSVGADNAAGKTARRAGGILQRGGKGRGVQESAAPAGNAPGGIVLGADKPDSFAVNVRNAEPIIRRLDTGKKRFALADGVQTNLATAVIVMSILWLIVTAAEEPFLILFTLPGLAVFMLMAVLENVDKERVRLYAALAILAVLIVTVIIFRNYIWSGCALIMNQLYDYAEEAQAYVYRRLPVWHMGDEHPYRSMHFALIWASCLLGLITSLPPLHARRSVAVAAAGFAMLLFAYYGMMPSVAVIAVFAAALVFVLSRGSFLSAIPVLLIVMLLFGAIVFIDPGESYSIARVNENFRDRFALRSSYLDANDPDAGELDELELEQQEQENREREAENSEFMKKHKALVGVIVALIILAAIAAAAWLFMQRLKKRQAKNRAGITSSDPREAIVAIFPYAVRWLQPAGIDPTGKAFASLIPIIKSDLSVQYADRYKDMYELWREAAYSDHEMTEERKAEMADFLSDTMRMIKARGDFKDRIVNTVKYAL